MNEKKLTDEEIIKAVDVCYNSPFCTSECPYFNKHGGNFCVENMALYKDMKRIVQKNAEQKAEIERLTEENGQLKGYNSGLEYELELKQKQVDELKANQVIECHGMLKGCDMVKQAVKETAKEICDLILESWERKQFVECDWLRVAISEKYGVEVE